MRDWNPAKVIILLKDKDFQPTYEGLKRKARISRYKYLAVSNFQPTYEGLKHFWTSLSFFHSPDFQPTYEGLKRIGVISRDKFEAGIFSLPMRDWNKEIKNEVFDS